MRAATPADALQRMKVIDGFRVKLVASEPEIRQPISVTFDNRGRMWVIQYLQYPTPAGLKPVKVDSYLRTTYDRVPEPPPRGPQGADRITICEDTDGDGRMDQFKDFLTGLNLCSGLALGYGGAFVLQAPYLLFYPDKNGDDIPDSDPEVLLSGFGMEDAHALANSLTWGPDGWLYGAQGSTVTANVHGKEFQQAIWRYHPVTHAFEVFAEGGGNTWGMDFDSDGEIFAGTNYYEKMLHMRQGAYYIKNFGKHGALHNPHAYGYFDHVPFSGYKGLHISIGGIVYHGGAFGNEFEGKYVFGNTLDHAVYWATLDRQRSTFTSTFGGFLMKTDDELFRPVDCAAGPDGALYIADWCDKRATHVDPLDTWDRSNGRVYKIERNDADANKVPVPFNLQKLSSSQLVDLLGHTNDWFVRGAQRLLAERHDRTVVPRLIEQLSRGSSHLQTEVLWALYVSGGFDDKVALSGLVHSNETVRKWSVRFLGDKRRISQKPAAALVYMAKTDSSPDVRAQLACSIRRLSPNIALPVLHELLLRDDSEDPHIPLLLWWAMEEHAITNRAGILKIFADKRVWQSRLVRKDILQRISRRYTTEGTAIDLGACVTLLNDAAKFAPPVNGWRLTAETEALLRGMNEALAGRTSPKPSGAVGQWFAALPAEAREHPLVLQTGVRFGVPEAHASALERIRDDKRNEAEHITLIETLAATRKPELIPHFLTILEHASSEGVRSAALGALQQLPSEQATQKIIAFYPKFSPPLRARAIQLLAARPASAAELMTAVEAGVIPLKEVSMEQVRQMAGLKVPALTARIQKMWGKFQSDSPTDKQNFINELKLVLKPSGAAGREPKPNLVEGKKLFQQSCGVCHKLFGEGNSIGPDLTGVDRKDIDFLLANIVNPSGYIRNEYVAFELETKDGEVVSGLMADSNPGSVTILSRSNEKRVVPRDNIKTLNESATSLMPEGLLEPLQPQQLIDLIGYLRSN